MKTGADLPITDATSARPTPFAPLREPLTWQLRLVRMVLLLGAIVSPLTIGATARAAVVPYPSEGYEIEEVQQRLNQLKYSINVDGVYGEETRQAVLDFQRNCGFYVDGVVGEDTAQGLNGGCLRERSQSFPGAGGSRPGSSYLSGKFVVMIPTDNQQTLNQVKVYVPDAFVNRYAGRLGSFIQIGVYDRRSRYMAESQYRYLQQQGVKKNLPALRDAQMRLFK